MAVIGIRRKRGVVNLENVLGRRRVEVAIALPDGDVIHANCFVMFRVFGG
jgi:hypothetical protein